MSGAATHISAQFPIESPPETTHRLAEIYEIATTINNMFHVSEYIDELSTEDEGAYSDENQGSSL